MDDGGVCGNLFLVEELFVGDLYCVVLFEGGWYGFGNVYVVYVVVLFVE